MANSLKRPFFDADSLPLLDQNREEPGRLNQETQDAQEEDDRPAKKNRGPRHVCRFCAQSFKSRSHLDLIQGPGPSLCNEDSSGLGIRSKALDPVPQSGVLVNEHGSVFNTEEKETSRSLEVTITRNTDLPTAIEYLTQNGCADVTGELTNVSDHYIFSGGQSDIHKAQLKNGTRVSVKRLREISNSTSDYSKILKRTARELYLWNVSTHTNILELIGLAVVRGKLAMVAPWMEYGSLRIYTTARPDADRCALCAQVAEGLIHMHTSGVVHGDMKGNNIVVSKEGVAKITDFGCATMMREFVVAFTVTTSVNFSARWAAPEIVLETGPPSFESDIYALGMVEKEAITGDVPYKEIRTDVAVVAAILQNKLPDQPDYISSNSKKGDELWCLMKRCWDRVPLSRPSMAEIKNFLKGAMDKYVMHN
ncbi:unnamed protein product [Rhizoctonia solani]|uniref:Protein kinase domain-containing protein n=1 Tax=Rhizoctonia solani TaxID=456999 RepID=A0A8H2WE76_9AGAM|nr:unnamed protein product [Rhizoctonia solani]